MAKMPVVIGGLPLVMFDTALVPAVMEDPCDCCLGEPCIDCDAESLTPSITIPVGDGTCTCRGTFTLTWAPFGGGQCGGLSSSCPEGICVVGYIPIGTDPGIQACMAHCDNTGITRLAIECIGTIWMDDLADPDGAIYCTGVAGVSLPCILNCAGSCFGNATWN